MRPALGISCDTCSTCPDRPGWASVYYYTPSHRAGTVRTQSCTLSGNASEHFSLICGLIKRNWSVHSVWTTSFEAVLPRVFSSILPAHTLLIFAFLLIQAAWMGSLITKGAFVPSSNQNGSAGLKGDGTRIHGCLRRDKVSDYG